MRIPYEEAENDWRRLKHRIEPLMDEWSDGVGRTFRETHWREFGTIAPEHLEQLGILKEIIESSFKRL